MELLEAVRGGDTAAFGTLYRRHSVAARSLARQIAQSEDTAEDLLVETFARVLEVVRRGGGPASAFRPYLLASLRRYAATGAVDLADGDSLYVDPELAGLERSLLARAYRSLPERWRMLLWHVEIEGGRPADTGPLLGMSGRAAMCLFRRARQGLREAYVRLHLENDPRAECRPILSMILRYVGNGLPKKEAGAVDAHVAECIDCRSVFLQMVGLTQELRAVVGQLVAGPAVDDYLAGLAAATATGSRSSGDGTTSGTSGRGSDGGVGGRVDGVGNGVRGRANALLQAYGRARVTTRRVCGKAGAMPRAVVTRARAAAGRARPGLGWVAFVRAKTGQTWASAGAAARATFTRARAALARLSALVRSVPTPQRAVLGGIAVAGLATAAFLLVAQPTGMFSTVGSGDGPRDREGTRALDRPRGADGGASRSQTATGRAGSAEPTNPHDPTRPSARTSGTAGDDPAAGSPPGSPGAGIALGMPETTGRGTPGADRRSRREEAPPQGSGAQGGSPRDSMTQGSTAEGSGTQGGSAGGRAGGRDGGEPGAAAVLAGRDRGVHTDASRGPAPERQRVRGQLSRHPYQDQREQVRARSSAGGGAWQAPGRAGDRHEPQARRPATGGTPLVSLGDALGRPQAGERGRAAQERGRPDGSGAASHEVVGSGNNHKPAVSGKKAKETIVVAVDPLGALLRGQPGLVAVRVRNAGDAATAGVTATVTLPPGVRYVNQDERGGRNRTANGASQSPVNGDRRQSHEAKPDVMGQNGGTPADRRANDGTGQGHTTGGRAERARTGSGVDDDWACEASGRLASSSQTSSNKTSGNKTSGNKTSGSTVRCVRGPLAGGEVTAIFLKVTVAADAPTGRAFTVRVRSGRLETTAESTVGVRASGAAARFAADGRLAARVVGNVLVGSAAPAAPCGAAAGGRNPGVSVPVDLDRDPSTRTSSCADLSLPGGGQVLWAGLYWSGGGRGVVPAEDIRVRAPGRPGYATLHAAEVARRTLPIGSGYQAFADVTSLVRTAGGGRWWVAGVPARAGTVRHAAWGLVVIVTDARQPYTRAAVLDAAAVVGGEEKALRLPLDGLAPDGAPARIDLMVWNGEGVRAGVVTVGDRAQREDRHRPGVLGRSDAGGVVVDTLHALLGPHPALQLATGRDPVFFGVAVVSARTWS
ncbi:hypothetical protein AB0O28_01430 [Microbispora sp. NPDC088329]|uniref:hypothetical protein n=1 Tax=Microbispora sp. NPDC088329 TaxID=3154869 RepID=UPI0034369ACE